MLCDALACCMFNTFYYFGTVNDYWVRTRITMLEERSPNPHCPSSAVSTLQEVSKAREDSKLLLSAHLRHGCGTTLVKFLIRLQQVSTVAMQR